MHDRFAESTCKTRSCVGWDVRCQRADLLFQILSQRYERGSAVITTNRVYRKWPENFNNDATLTSAVLDRLLHHAETVVIEGKRFRMKEANTDS